MIGRCAATYYENRSSEFVRQIQTADDATDITGEECQVFKRVAKQVIQGVFDQSYFPLTIDAVND